MMDEIINRTQSILTKFTNFQIKEVGPYTTLQDLGLSSLDVVSLAFEIEEAFNIRIEENELGQFYTFGDVLEYLKKRVYVSKRSDL